jgi:hypothetical protein
MPPYIHGMPRRTQAALIAILVPALSQASKTISTPSIRESMLAPVTSMAWGSTRTLLLMPASLLAAMSAL